MKLKLYQVDAFTDKVFGGNPAGVILTDKPLNEKLMQNIAAENNLAETAFMVRTEDIFEIRWFTPVAEVDLCGHATLASAHVLYEYYNYSSDEIIFISPRSGKLTVTKENDLLTMDFPTDTINQTVAPKVLKEALKISPVESYKGKTDYMLVYESQDIIESFDPDFVLLARVGGRGVIVTAPGNDVDFVSRFFAPHVGINEDPVTGSAHTSLTQYWAKRLNKDELTAMQISERVGYLKCRFMGDRTIISGQAVCYLIGEIEV